MKGITQLIAGGYNKATAFDAKRQSGPVIFQFPNKAALEKAWADGSSRGKSATMSVNWFFQHHQRQRR